MSSNQQPTKVQSADGRATLSGTHSQYRLETRPSWVLEDGKWVLADVDQILTLTLYLARDISNPAEARRAATHIACGSAIVSLPGLQFLGYPTRCEYVENANQVGEYACGELLLTIQGHEE